MQQHASASDSKLQSQKARVQEKSGTSDELG